MKKFYVKWGLTDSYGRVYEEYANFDWFETPEQADEFIVKMKRGNGSYFKLWKVAEGNFANYLRINELLVEIEHLKKEFE